MIQALPAQVPFMITQHKSSGCVKWATMKKKAARRLETKEAAS